MSVEALRLIQQLAREVAVIADLVDLPQTAKRIRDIGLKAEWEEDIAYERNEVTGSPI